MKVRIIQSLISNVHPFRAGDIAILSDKEAKALIKAGHAIELKEVETAKAKINPQTANIPTAEKKPRRRKRK